jgi:DNA-binding MarR family transcriptional regulator
MKDYNSSGKEILDTCSVKLIGLSVMMASRSVERFFNAKLKMSGVRMSKLYVMYAIAEYRGKNISYIADKLFMDRSTLKRIVENNKEYIEFHKNPLDKRYMYPALTPQGAEFLKKWMPRLMSIERGLGVLVQDKENFINFIKIFSSDIVRGIKIDKTVEAEEETAPENNKQEQ